MSSYLPQFCCFILRGSFPSTGRQSHHEVSEQLLHVSHESWNAKDTQFSPAQDYIHSIPFLVYVCVCVCNSNSNTILFVYGWRSIHSGVKPRRYRRKHRGTLDVKIPRRFLVDYVSWYMGLTKFSLQLTGITTSNLVLFLLMRPKDNFFVDFT